MLLKKILFVIKNHFFQKKSNDVLKDEECLKYNVMKGTILSGENKIGDYSYIGFNCNITKSTIGRYCSIANNVSIGIGEHKIKRVSTSSLFYSNPFETLTEKECKIGNDVWIGSNTVIRRGVTVGDGAIIGANSFVNKDVKDFEIVGGSPSKHIRMRFDKNTIFEIKKSCWWDYNINEAKNKISELENLDLFDIEE